MKHLYLLFILFYAFPLSAQDMLNFPKEYSKSLSATPLDVCLRQSSETLEHLNDKDISQAHQLSLYGQQLLHLGQHEYAKEVFEKVLEINNQAYGKSDIRYVKALLDLANAYMLLIRYNEAAGMYEEALTTVKKTLGIQSPEYLETLNESGFVYTRVQNWNKGISMYKEGLRIIKKQHKTNTIYHAIILNNLGVCIKNNYNYKAAIKNYEAALKIAQQSPRLAISIAANLAECYALVERKKEAKDLLLQYTPIAKKIISTKDLTFARVWMQYGVAYTALNDFDGAKEAFTNAFLANSLTFTSLSSIPDQADDLMFKNDFLATCGQAGIMMYSIEMYKRLYEATNDVTALKDGYKIVKAMTKYGEKLMSSYLSEANKLILFRLGAAVLFDRSIYYAYELHQHTKDKQYIEDAFFFSERSKSTLLVNALRSKENQKLLDLPTGILTKEKNYKATLKNLQKRQIEAATKEEQNQIQQEINDLNIKIEQFKESLQKDYPDYYQHRYSIALSNLESVQNFLAKDNKVLIEYALGLEFHYAFVVTKNTLDIVPLNFNPTAFNQHTLNLRKTLTNYRFITKNSVQADSLFRNSASYFYTTFVKPLLAKTTKGQHLIIVPDQNLGHLPFETFLTTAPQKALDFANYPYLLKEYPISYSYSATILMGQEQRQQSRNVPKRGVLAFAAEYPKVSANSFSHQRSGNIGIVREGLQPLPGAQKEVELMQQYLFGEFHNGLTASERNFKKNAADYGIIHLAMHGVLDNKNPILSSLVFSEDSSTVEDNFLRAYEIAQLDLNADLVVLSACETGYGKFQQGEGVMSLAHSFSYAGASSILMSLWQVNDFSTSQIMKNFYVNIAKGWTKEKALRAAKLDYLSDQHNKAALHPAFWAAFVQTGDVEALELVAKSGKTFKEMGMMMMSGLALLVVLLGYGFFRWYRQR
ncbi:CHAT domain-containing protein [Aureispira anguillae]|uniref:CHAT domain-containing protein n=1 Tax=Aureispira anguillae TaxID=2864201 RepID=A0A915YJU2_9BACT|nr:CHAT domain-containing tetratricopeptide repeat protein [Aureispira anguillae]BDS14555.1 CHAT domain-containing protein [Aureispira anguillae]